MLKKVVFLDRDGVINQDSPEYIKSWSEFQFIPGSLAAIRELTHNGFTIILITNQSVISRNITTLENVEYIHSMIKKVVASEGGNITDIFFCPHTDEDECTCRKPKPGMIDQARQKYEINLDSACMVGDSARDIECARNAGCARTILVKTGNGTAAEKILSEKNILPDYVAKDLWDAAKWITLEIKN